MKVLKPNQDNVGRHPCRRCARPINNNPRQSVCTTCLRMERAASRRAPEREAVFASRIAIVDADYENPPEFRHDNYR